MDKISYEFPRISVPSSGMFLYPSRIYNTYEPKSLMLLLDSFDLPDDAAMIGLSKAETHHPVSQSKLKTWIKSISFQRDRVDLGDKIVWDARHSGVSNYAHLIHDNISYLHFAMQLLDVKATDIKVLLPRKNPSFVEKAFSALGFEMIFSNGIVGGNILSIQIKEPRRLLPYMNKIRLPGERKNQPLRKIFVSRRGNRKLLNEAEVEGYLKSKGYIKIYLEDMDLLEQWRLFSGVESVVGIHGAGLANLAFCSQAEAQVNLYEIFSTGLISDVYRRYSAVNSGGWVGVLGKIGPEVMHIDKVDDFKRFCFDDFYVSLESLECALEYL